MNSQVCKIYDVIVNSSIGNYKKQYFCPFFLVELKWRSRPVNPPKPIPPPPRVLTQAEKEYLEFFTEYCKYTDNPKTYGIDPFCNK